ncbi:MAG: phosphoribosyltransferase family protein [bacterium]|nr:phosphoribosyltransferase family protein [bacterium]
MRALKNFILDLIFPRRCLGCKQVDTWLCESCFKLIEQYEGQHIDYRLKHLNRLIVASPYSKNKLLTTAIHTLKYQRHPEDIAEKLGSMLARSLKFGLNQITTRPGQDYCLIPVPLHRRRCRERGFNQAEELAKAVEESLRACKAISLDSSLLNRDRYTTSQVKAGSRQARLKNLEKAFSTTDKINPETTCILVDDVATTGTTLEECAKVLRKAGAQQVWGLVVARN